MRFQRPRPLAWIAAAVLSLPGGLSGAPADDAPVVFNRDIRPILSDNCFACHGFDPKTRKARLRLDTAEGAYGPGRSDAIAIRPGDPENSEVWRRIVSDDPDEVMPPGSAHKTLTQAQKDLLRRWIEQGAPYQRHWSFEPPELPAPPPDPAVAHPLDRFLQHRLKQEGLGPSPEADRPTLIRRLTFDLHGLPPTPSQVDAFVADARPGAYERLVERLLASPRYGEQMARHWLDVARYADTHGLHLDNERSMWPYRDWVVAAFNSNLPYDRFVVEQLAGDLLPHPSRDQLIATGFNRNNVTTSEGGSIDAEFVFRYAVDRTSTAVETFMGLTAGCAVCHDHKYDPISSREFYSLYAFFHSAADPAMDGNIATTPPILKLTTPEDEARLARYDADLQAAEAALVPALATLTYSDPAALQPPPEPQDVETVWADDAAPDGWRVNASPGAATAFVSEGAVPPLSGRRALRREDKGLAQDVFEGSPGLTLPTDARLFAHVHLDPSNPPRAIMLQYHTGEWRHRAVWGDYDVIDWGARDTPERVHMGPLPETGRWIRLEVPAATVGLKAGTKVTGFALTQHGGTVHWDKVGVAGRVDPARDPSRSFAAWSNPLLGKPSADLPEGLRPKFKDGVPETPSPEQRKELLGYYLIHVCAETRKVFDPLLARAAAIRKERTDYAGTIPATLVWKDLEKPRESHVMIRGAYDRPGERVTPNVPEALPPLAHTGNPTRLDFARWLVREDHPLTARVAVNRIWQQFFGLGLVKTSGDFGSQGTPPSHPELLDWLAVTFRESGWDIKRLVRLIVTSAAYRQSSRVSPDLWQRDPENVLLARASRHRLDAEQIRDNALFVSGLLVDVMGGKGVKPYQPPNIWEPVGFVGSNTREYRQDTGAALYRRSLYTFFKRTAPPPYMATFDAPNREQFCTRRERSNTPLQALQLLNDVQHVEAARALAQRALLEGGATARQRLAFAFRTVLARPPGEDELAVIEQTLRHHLERYRNDPQAALQLVTVGESRPAPSLDASELAAYTLAANLLLNLDETLTRN